jgi:hypothetical protein
MLPPIPRCSVWTYHFAHFIRTYQPSPIWQSVGLHIVFFEACSAFTRVAACTLALSSIRDTLIEGFSHFVTSMTAPIASGWSFRLERLPGGACTHWKAPPFHGARQKQSSSWQKVNPTWQKILVVIAHANSKLGDLGRSEFTPYFVGSR